MMIPLAIKEHRKLTSLDKKEGLSFSAKQPPTQAFGFELPTENPDTRRLNYVSYEYSNLNSSF